MSFSKSDEYKNKRFSNKGPKMLPKHVRQGVM
jgi:hypothetical protein